MSASADPVLTVSDGVTSSGPIVITGGAGSYSTASFDSSWGLVSIAALSKPVIGSASNPNMELNIQATSLGSANPLTVVLSDNNFGPTSGSNNVISQLTGQPFGGAGAVVTFDTYYDSNNVMSALTTPLTASGDLLPNGSPNPYNSNGSNSLSLAGPYSLSEVVTISGSNAAGYSLLVNLQGSNQPCTCTVSFNCPTNATICESDPVPNPYLEASNIVATDTCRGTVPVTFMGAVTNGACPSPSTITYTFGATSGCGILSTCNQTITILCSPDCTISTVSNTIAGTSNLTASVANAGTGATYAWIVNNGVITAGQGTPTITYTAGDDTNNPVGICVTVTSLAGCPSTCCDSVKVSPQPPKTNLGMGDTATIGFWHNKNGQAVINSASNSPALANWLATSFPCLFGNLAGDSNAQVAAAFETAFGNVGGLQGNDYCQIFGAALASYFTSTSLGGDPEAVKFGFNQSPGGTGGKLFNVGNNGAAFGVPNNTSLTVLQLLQAANNLDCPLSGDSKDVLGELNNVFNGVNTTGDIK